MHNHRRHIVPDTVRRACSLFAFLSLFASSAFAQGWGAEVRLPTATQEVSVVGLNGIVYVAAGSFNQARTNALWSYNPSTQAWTSLAPYPGTAVDHANLVTVGGFLYLIGGVSGWPEPAVAQVARYDPSTNTWSVVAPLPIARGAIGSAVVNGKIYVVGGLEAGVSVADFTVYDPSTNAWTSLPSMPTARDHLAAAAVNGKFYAIGGRVNGQNCSPFNIVEVYDPATNAWTTGTPMLNAHAGQAVGTANGHIQVFGGEGAPTTCGAIAAAEDYDPVANVWTPLPDMLTPRHGIGAATVNASVYLPGGGTWTGDAATPIQERFDATGPNSTEPVPSPWADIDIGAPSLAGSASYTNGMFVTRASGADIWGAADAFHFVYQPLNGDGQIVARVVGLGYTSQYAKAGVMIRGDLTAGAPHVLLDAKPDNTVEFMTRTASGGSTTYLAGGSFNQPVWLKLVRSGTTFTASVSTDGAAWTSTGSTSVSLGTSVYVGLAVTSHNTSAMTAATIDNVTVTSAGGTDTPPTVTLTSPSNGATYTAPATVSLAANASDPDGTVTRVDFYSNSTLIGTSTTAPYGGTWNNVPAGSYNITAVATDNAGLQTTSAPASITVNSATSSCTPPSGWSDNDIGTVGLAGSACYSSGVFTVNAAGADIWGTADSFNYLSQPFSGDGQIVARVTALQNTNTYAKAGVMFRDALTAGAIDVVLDVRPAGGVEFMTRTATGGATTFIAGGTQAFPAWLKLVRSGSTFTASASADGVTWTPIGTTSVTMSASANVGLAVTSHNTSALTTATIDNVTVTAASTATAPGAPSSPSPSNGATGVSTAPTLTWTSTGATSYDVGFGTTNPPPTVSTGQSAASYTPPSVLTAGAVYYWQIVAHNSGGSTTGSIWSFTTAAASGGGCLPPAPWYDNDIGTVGLSGNFCYSSGVFTINAAGADIWGAADSFNYMNQPFSGDGQIVARVTGLQNTNTYAKAGVMFRDSLNADAVDVVLDVRPGGGIEFMTRTATGGSTTFVAGGAQTIPAWLKLVRSGSTVTGFASADGATWTQIGTTSVAMAANGYVGLAVTSHNTSALTTATIDNVTVTSASTVPGAPSSPSPADGATGVSTTPTLTWTSSGATNYDVAFGTTNPPPTVSTGQAAASYTPPSGLTNSTTYYWQIVAHNSAGSATGSAWSFTTASTTAAPAAPTSPSPADSATGVSTRVTLTWTSAGATSYDIAFGTATPPPTVATGQASASYTPPLLDSGVVYYWQIVAHNSGGSTTGPIWSFTTAPAASGGLPTPWTNEDIGTVGIAGSATYNSGVFTVVAAGSDIWGTADSFNYTSQPFSGDGQIVARVATLQETNAYAKAGVMFRETLTAGSIDVIFDVRPTGDLEFMMRSATGGSTTFIIGGTQVPPAWLKLTRSGSTFTASASADGVTWTQIATTSVTMATNAFVGLAVTSHTTSATTTATIDNVTVTAATAAPPVAPTPLNPQNTATNVSTTPTLMWTSSGATSYDVAFGSSNPPPTVSTAQPSPSYAPPSTLANSVTYYWQIVAHNSVGTTPGAVWSFTTTAPLPPGTPQSPSPADFASAVSTTPTLTWSDAAATSYDVAFGAADPPPVVSTAQTSTSYTPAALAANATYFWRIVAHNAVGTTTGPTWEFTTGVTTNGGVLPAPWQNGDIGTVGTAGSSSYSAGTFRVTGAGADIGGTADAFQFAYQPLNGDGQITARVAGVQNTSGLAKAGVMIRETLDAGAADAIVDIRADGALDFLARSATGAATTTVATEPLTSIPMWVRVARTGTTIVGYVSQDGSTWTSVGTTTVSMAASVYVGLAVTSGTASAVNSSTFDNVTVGGVSMPPAPTLTFTRKALAIGGTGSGTAVGISGFASPTTLTMGPDGNLYVATVNGQIYVLTLNHTTLMQPGQISVTHVQEIDAIFLKPSIVCDDTGNNCQLETGSVSRQVTGMAIDPSSTPGNIILYVSNSNLGRGATDITIYTYSGTITRLVLQPDPNNAGNYLVASNQDLVIGLPRSRESHAPNGMSIGPDGWLYLAIGSNTNAGQPSSFFLNLPEYYLSAGVLRLNLAALPATLPIDTTQVKTGADMAAWSGIFELYATGYRNPYDLVWHTNGKLYMNMNSANLTQGLAPGSTDGCTTPAIDVGTPPDYLYLVTQGARGPHANPARGECVWGDGATHYWDDGTMYNPPLAADPHYTPPIADYVRDAGDSSDGIVEYISNAFGGVIQHNLISATFDGDQNLRRIVLTPDGTGVQGVYLMGQFNEPIDVWSDVPGNIYVAEYGANQITLLIPAQPGS